MYIIYNIGFDEEIRILGYSENRNIESFINQCYELCKELKEHSKKDPNVKERIGDLYKQIKSYQDISKLYSNLVSKGIDVKDNKEKLNEVNSKTSSLFDQVDAIKNGNKEAFETERKNILNKYSEDIRKIYKHYKEFFETDSIIVEEIHEFEI